MWTEEAEAGQQLAGVPVLVCGLRGRLASASLLFPGESGRRSSSGCKGCAMSRCDALRSLPPAPGTSLPYQEQLKAHISIPRTRQGLWLQQYACWPDVCHPYSNKGREALCHSHEHKPLSSLLTQDKNTHSTPKLLYNIVNIFSLPS